MYKRLASLIKALELSAAQFADEIGVQRSSISHVISGRNKPSMDFIEKILHRYPRVNADWLIMGSGSVFRDEDLFSGQDKDSPKAKVRDLPAPEVGQEAATTGSNEKKAEKAIDMKEPTVASAQVNRSDDKKQVRELILIYNDNTFRVLKPEDPIA